MRRRSAFNGTAFVALTGSILMLPPVVEALTGQIVDSVLLRAQPYLETRFARLPDAHLSNVSGIVILGGSYSRIDEAARISAEWPEATIILTGADAREVNRLGDLGIAHDRLIVETEARNTFENAIFSLRLAHPRPDEGWVLVTSAMHMPRAAGAFQAAGFPVVPWQVHDTPKRRKQALALVRYELVALVAYRLMGRTSELLPTNIHSAPPTQANATVGRAGQAVAVRQ